MKTKSTNSIKGGGGGGEEEKKAIYILNSLGCCLLFPQLGPTIMLMARYSDRIMYVPSKVYSQIKIDFQYYSAHLCHLVYERQQRMPIRTYLRCLSSISSSSQLCTSQYFHLIPRDLFSLSLYFDFLNLKTVKKEKGREKMLKAGLGEEKGEKRSRGKKAKRRNAVAASI